MRRDAAPRQPSNSSPHAPIRSSMGLKSVISGWFTDPTPKSGISATGHAQRSSNEVLGARSVELSGALNRLGVKDKPAAAYQLTEVWPYEVALEPHLAKVASRADHRQGLPPQDPHLDSRSLWMISRPSDDRVLGFLADYRLNGTRSLVVVSPDAKQSLSLGSPQDRASFAKDQFVR